MINNLEELSIEMGVGPTERSISKALFKATECGITFNHGPSGISLRGYAEGAEAECGAIELTYPFDVEDFWEAVEDADKEGCAMWDEWNLVLDEFGQEFDEWDLMEIEELT